jgi:Tfp pilus assembly protein PilE
VELIIVITILAILAVIAFVSFENFTKDTRDANRVAVMKNIENGLEIFAIKSESGKYPMPDSPETLTGSNNQGLIYK